MMTFFLLFSDCWIDMFVIFQMLSQKSCPNSAANLSVFVPFFVLILSHITLFLQVTMTVTVRVIGTVAVDVAASARPALLVGPSAVVSFICA